MHDENGDLVRGDLIPMTNLRTPIYEKQPQESFSQFGRFQLYRDMGASRTYVQVAEEVGRERSIIDDQAGRWRWKERAEAWDRHLDDIRMKAIEDAGRTMASRQAKLGMMLQDKATNALESLDLTEATVGDVVKLAEAGVKIERLARGEKTEDAGGIVINLPVLPGWARTSAFVNVTPPAALEGEPVEEVQIATNSETEEGTACAATESDRS